MTSAEDAVRLVRSGDRVYVGSNCGQPRTLCEALVGRWNDLRGVEIVHILVAGDAPYTDPKYAESFHHLSLFTSPSVRKAVQSGDADYLPVFLGEIPAMFRNGQLPIDVAMVAVSPPDEHGFCSLGISVDIGLSACRSARTVLAEVHPEMPRTLGDCFLHTSEIDRLVEPRYPILEHPAEEPDETSDRIAAYIADLIEDGSTIQTGIGKIPDAVLAAIDDKSDLGIHTEMFSDGLIGAIERGNVTCRAKSYHPGKVVSSFVMGSKRLYAFIDNNPFFEFHPSEFVNDPFVIAQNDRMVSINSALEVDLTGQVVADSIGHTIYSGIGGQVDFVRGAVRSKGGKPIIALLSTAKSGELSRIVSALKPGAGVVTSRGDVHYVATEFGVAYLHGKPIRERALSLIRIAHPKFRDQLLEEAKEIGLIPRAQPSLAHRYPDEFVREIGLPGGGTIWLRPILATDERLLREHFHALGVESVRKRFGHALRSLSRAEFSELVNIDYKQHMAIVAVERTGEAERILAVGRYYVNLTTNFAEVAMAVRDDWQGKGLGTAVFGLLVECAQSARLKGFDALLDPGNAQMQAVFTNSGLRSESALESGQVKLRLHLGPEKHTSTIAEVARTE